MTSIYSTNYSVHRLVPKAFIVNDDPTKKTQVNHIDGNKTNNNVSNLELVSAATNNLHAAETGLRQSKKKKSNTKIT